MQNAKCKMQNAKCHGFILLILCLSFFFGSNVLASGFWDQGLVSGKVRTDYNQFNRGSYSLPISYTYPSPYFLPCQGAHSWCGTGPTGFPQANSWSNAGFGVANYWVLSFNNEDAFNKKDNAGNIISYTQNPGPPNQSMPRSAPGSGLMGFTVIQDAAAGENFKRAHLVMNNYYPNPQVGGIPYMSIGAQGNRGNGMQVGHLNGPWWYKNNVKFRAKVYHLDEPSQVTTEQPAIMLFMLYAVTEWGGKQRGLFVHLYHHNFETSTTNGVFGTPFNWNWPIKESFYYPGADIVHMDAEDMLQNCGIHVPRLTHVNQQINYNLDLTALFRCASNKGLFENASQMPTSILPIKGVHWATEMTGKNGAIWVAVDGMKML